MSKEYYCTNCEAIISEIDVEDGKCTFCDDAINTQGKKSKLLSEVYALERIKELEAIIKEAIDYNTKNLGLREVTKILEKGI